jgi:copper transport protein
MKTRLRLCLILIGVWLALGTQPAEAHGYLVRSVPADRVVLDYAPNQVQIWFSEGLEPRFSTVAVFDQTGRQVDLGGGGVDAQNPAKLVVNLPPHLPDGAYLVKLRPVFVSDGHAVNDTLVFWIGNPAGRVAAQGTTNTPVPLEVIWRVGLTLSLTVLFGTFLMYTLVLRPAWGNKSYSLGYLPPRIMKRLTILIWGSLLIALFSNWLALLQTTMTLFEVKIWDALDSDLWNIVLSGTNFGDVWGIRMGLLVAMLVIQIIAAQQAHNRPASTHLLWLLNGCLAVGGLITMSLISHAAGSPLWNALGVIYDAIHLIAVAGWVGGLTVIALILRPALSPLEPAERGHAILALLKRFSLLATASLSLIIATGIYSSLANLYTPRDLTGTTYGLNLLAKWVLMVPLIALGGLHFVLVSPQRLSWITTVLKTHQRFLQLPATLRLEMCFAVIVLVVAGFLPATPPPAPDKTQAATAPLAQNLIVEGYDVRLNISPSIVGTNSVEVRITQDSQPANLKAVRLRYSDPAFGRYTDPIWLDSIEPGLWVGAGGEINRPATWQVLIDFFPPDAPSIRAAFQWKMMDEIQNGRSPSILNGLSVAVVIALLLFGGIYLSWQPIQKLHWTPENAVVAGLAIGLTIAMIIGGAILFAQTEQHVQKRKNQPPHLVNPILADQAALSRGRELFRQECWICHGENGTGATPFAINLTRPVPNLTEALGVRTDEDLFRILTQGMVNRHLFGKNLSESDRWHLIIYLRYIDILVPRVQYYN